MGELETRILEGKIVSSVIDKYTIDKIVMLGTGFNLKDSQELVVVPGRHQGLISGRYAIVRGRSDIYGSNQFVGYNIKAYNEKGGKLLFEDNVPEKTSTRKESRRS